jgi:crossover junction endodeoxyribonuclease RuvC
MKGQEKIILGIDPGTSVMGYGVIKVIDKKTQLLQYGVIHLSKYKGQEIKLRRILEKMLSLIEEFLPDQVALEAPFFGKNIQSMLKLGRAQGVAMAAALSRDIPIAEYAPRRIKQSVTGNGNASKEQVAKMLQNLLDFKHDDKLLDATDALAVALCHHYQNFSSKPKVKSWSAFVRNNADRVKK